MKFGWENSLGCWQGQETAQDAGSTGLSNCTQGTFCRGNLESSSLSSSTEPVACWYGRRGTWSPLDQETAQDAGSTGLSNCTQGTFCTGNLEKLSSVKRFMEAPGATTIVSRFQNRVYVGTTKKTRQAPPLELELRGQRLEQCPSVKLLGLHLDQNLTYDNHIAHIVKKCNRSLAQVGRVKDLLPHRQRIAVVNALIIPHIDYCCSAWGNTTQNNIRRLQVVQNRAARLALGCDRDAHVDTMLKTLGWLTVRDRIQQRSLVTFKRIMLTKQPKALYDKITFQSEIHNLCVSKNIDLSQARFWIRADDPEPYLSMVLDKARFYIQQEVSIAVHREMLSLSLR
ncbi:hypothetical protein Bbelb_228700 [Branchiostoma belcheri]|nr:hypothetical protein Bbelb_228700 [Branchiostoma belcheri]